MVKKYIFGVEKVNRSASTLFKNYVLKKEISPFILIFSIFCPPRSACKIIFQNLPRQDEINVDQQTFDESSSEQIWRCLDLTNFLRYTRWRTFACYTLLTTCNYSPAESFGNSYWSWCRMSATLIYHGGKATCTLFEDWNYLHERRLEGWWWWRWGQHWTFSINWGVQKW